MYGIHDRSDSGRVGQILARTGRPVIRGRDIDASTSPSEIGWPVARVDAEDTTVTVRQDLAGAGLLIEITTRMAAERDGLTVTLDGRCRPRSRCDLRGVEPAAAVLLLHQPRRARARQPLADRLHGRHRPDDRSTSSPGTADLQPDPAQDPGRRLVVTGNKAWQAAAEVRHRWLAASLFPRKSAPREAHAFLARQLLAMPGPARSAPT